MIREHSRKGKYHCTAYLLFILFEFICFAHVELVSVVLVWSIPNQSNRRSVIQWYFPPPTVSVLGEMDKLNIRVFTQLVLIRNFLCVWAGLTYKWTIHSSTHPFEWGLLLKHQNVGTFVCFGFKNIFAQMQNDPG